MRKEIPYFAIGNNELEKLKPVGETAKCPKCKKRHKVEYGKKKMPDGHYEETKMLGFVKCGEDSYLVSVNGKELK